MKKFFSKKAVKLIILIIVAAALSISLKIIKTQEYSDWLPTYAVITDWKKSMSKNPGYNLYFEYNVNGTQYSGRDSFSGSAPHDKVGDTVTVWYDPDDITRVIRSDTKPDAGLWTYAPFILAAPICIYIISGGNKRNSKKLL